jgi:hypothetical protein
MTIQSPAPTAPSFARPAPGTFARAVLRVALVAGTLDIVGAHLHQWLASGRPPATLLKTIVGGAVGRERALEGGVGMMALGLFFHYLIAAAFTLFFFLLYPHVSLLRKHRVLVGAAYALFAWSVMNYVVLPLSALPRRPPDYTNPNTYIGWGVLILAIGLPIAFGAARFYHRRPAGVSRSS